MGIFSRTPSQPPPAHLQIHLSPSTPSVLRPNDAVEGHISLTPTVPLSPHAVEVTLYGTSTVWLRTATGQVGNRAGDVNRRRYLHWRDNAPLFDVTHNAASPGTSFNPGETYHLPFSLILPAGTGNDRSHSYADASDTRWTALPHDLPPTFTFGHPRGFDESGPDCARIEYGVRAHVVCPGPQGPRGIAGADIPLFFGPLGRAPHAGPARVQVHSERFTVASSALLGGGDGEKVGLRQSVRDRLSSKTPKLEFTVNVQVPDELCSGAPFEVAVAVEAGPRSEGVRVPRVRVRVEKLDLLDFTFVRAPKDRNASTALSGSHSSIFSSASSDDGDLPPPDAPYSGREHDVFEQGKVRLNTVPESAWLALDGDDGTNRDDYDHHDEKKEKSSKAKEAEAEAEAESAHAQADTHTHHVSFSARVPGTTAPAFRSFAVTRAYRLRGRVVVEVGGKEFDVDLERDVGALFAC